MPDIGNIQPHTEFLVCYGMPMTPDYTDTLTFLSKEAQLEFYRKYAKFDLTSQTYQRVTSNKCRLELNAESVFECNYLCFCNHGYNAQAPYATVRNVPLGTDPETYVAHYPASWDKYGGISTPTQDKWWYAFITDITYVSNACVEITYQIDVMQSYMFDYTLPPTYIERMHIDAASDTIYTTRTDEDFDLGPLYARQLDVWYFNSNTDPKESGTTYKYLLLGGISNPDDIETGKPDGSVQFFPEIVGRYPTALSKVQLYSTLASLVGSDDAGGLRTYANNGKINNVVAVLAVPGIFDNGDLTNVNARTYDYGVDIHGEPEWLSTFFQYENNQIAWYQAINQKLQQYPFNRMVMSNFSDKEVTFRFELFNKRTLAENGGYRFRSYRSLLPSPCITVAPLDYLEQNSISEIGGEYISGFDPKHCIALDNYPQVAFGGSAYQNWWAQNMTSGALPIKALGNGMVSGLSTMIGALSLGAGKIAPIALGATMGGLNALNTAANSGVEGLKQKYAPDPISYASQNPNMSLNMDLNAVGFYHMAIGKAAAERIDNYFSRYGYALHYNAKPLGYRQDISTPGDRIRPRWNYLLLPNAILSASSPINATHQQVIKQVYAKGITFWHMNAQNDLSIVGDYSRAAQEANHPYYTPVQPPVV